MDERSEREHEAVLVRRARWGDRDAFAQLYEAHAAAVHSVALRLLGDRTAAEDITHDAFVRLLRFFGGFRQGEPLRPWIKRVAANLAIDRLRRERAHLHADIDDEWADPASGPPCHAESSALLRRLTPLARTLVWLHEVEGWSHVELGRRFGRSESWSKSIVSRALARLREDVHGERCDHPA